MQIGPHHFSGRFFLAPLAGVSDRPFRRICRDMGAAFTYTEMVSAHGLVHGTEQTESYLDRDPDENPFAVQIFASEPDVLARGAEAAVRHGAGIVDINMACPVKKVCGSGAGAALAREPGRVRAAVEAVRGAVGVPVTIKIRAGWDDQGINCVEVARAAEAAGASAVALHGRTRAQGYSGIARWDLIGAVKEAVSVPVLGSGDVWTAADAMRMARETRCDAVLVARGACGNPWIFRELAALDRGEPRPPPPSRDEWSAVVVRHVRLQIEHRQRQAPDDDPAHVERRAMRELRKHLLWYTRGLRGGVRFRRDADGLETLDDVRRLIDLHFPAHEPWTFETSADRGGAEAIQQMRALLLETSPPAYESACRSLGFEVVRVRTATEGRALVARERFDLIDGRIARTMPLDWEIRQRVDLFYEQLKGHSATGLYQAVLRQVERPLITAALAHANGVHAEAARVLGIDRGTLARRIRALRIET